MNPRVAIVGAHSTPLVSARFDVSLQDLAFQTAKAALDSAGVTRAEIDAVVICAHDLIDGRGIANMVAAGSAGAYMKSETRTTNDGLFGLILGCVSILAGKADLLLVIGWAKPSEGFRDAVTATEFEPFHQRPIGLTEARALGLQATSLLRRDGQAARAAATAAVMRDRRHGVENASAQLRQEVTVDDFATSRNVTWPLTELDLPPSSDGACALVLASERRAGGLASEPVWVDGMGWSSDGYALGSRDLSRSTSLERAARQAYRSAGLDGAVDVAAVEYAARSSFQHLVVVEGLALCDPGRGATFLTADRTSEQPAVNLSGGLASGNPLVAAGLVSTAFAAGLIRTSGFSRAVVHGTSGPCLQSNAVLILSAETKGR